MSNYELMSYYLDMIKEFAYLNPNKTITKDFVYSQLLKFNIRNDQLPLKSTEHLFNYWKNTFKNNNNIDVNRFNQMPKFLFFMKGDIKGNEIKLYVPMDMKHIKKGATDLFSFLASSNISHQSKIADIIRNDNVVIRVNSLEDAQTIINYVNSNNYIKEGLLKVNPFLANCNGVGLAMDNSFSFNSTLSNAISEYIEELKKYNRLDLFNVEGLNNYINKKKETITDLDIKDIYDLLSKTTQKNFELKDFVNHANNKLSDKYTSQRKRITDPKYYLEQAIRINNEVHPENNNACIKEYLKGNPNYFTNQEKARDGLKKYVHPKDVINIMRSTLNASNIKIPLNDDELIKQYSKIVLNENVINNKFNIIKEAYIKTYNKYGLVQAQTALKYLILNNEFKYFTNDDNMRNLLKYQLLNYNIKKIILSNIDITDLDINNIAEIICRFNEMSIIQNTQKSY